jgi:hypothetical protein
MKDQIQAPLLIHTRRGAILALCVGVLFALRDSRYLFELYVPGHTSWLTRYRFPPTHFSFIFDLFYAVLFAGVLIFILRRSRGGERVYLALFVCTVVFSPLKDIHSAASVHAYEWMEAILDLALVPIALWMYDTLRPRGAPIGGKISN